MSKRQLALFFLMNLFAYTSGSGTLPLLPVYATRLGATPAMAGYYLAAVYLAMAVGALAAGPLFTRTGRAKVFLIAAGVLGVPTAWLMGQVTNVWQLMALQAPFWGIYGLGFALINIRIGLDTAEHERGRTFGTLWLGTGLGTTIGGLVMGPIADHWGYPMVFAVCGLMSLLWLLAALFVQEERPRPDQRGEKTAQRRRVGLGPAFYFVVTAVTLAGVASFVITMGRSFAMNALGFSGVAISSTGAILGAASIPVRFLIGWLSDRVGRTPLLIGCYLALLAGLFMLSRAVALWHFWAAVGVWALSAGSAPVTSALAADLLPRESRAWGMSQYSTATWMSGVIGFAVTGSAVQYFGLKPTLLGAICLPLVAIALIASIRRPAAQPAPAAE